MKSTLKILKNNIFTIIVIIVFIIGMFCVSYVKKVYWDNNDEASYGERTEGVENHKISDDKVKELKSKISEEESKKSVNEQKLQYEQVKKIADVWGHIDKKGKNQLLKSIVDKIFIVNGDIEIRLKNYFH